MKKEDLRLKDYLAHMQEAMQRIHAYTKGMDNADFRANELIQDAVIRNLEVLGEAAHNIDDLFPAFVQQQAQVPWDDIYLMRNRISHGYFCVDLDIVWRTLQSDLPLLAEQIKALTEHIQTQA